MNIKMIGIDHSLASVDYRELFAFTKKSSVNAMMLMKNMEGVEGCVILSTCNRMELWISYKKEQTISLYQFLCTLKNLDMKQYENFFVEREGEEAVKHLFFLAGGLESKILGEDQIITQVKEAILLSRENYCTDNVLEVLFRMAITSGKEVKSSIHFTMNHHSVVDSAILALKEQGIVLKDKICMVIGNGEMGKLTASALVKEHAKVTVTIRQYKSGEVNIPMHCSRINYGERYLFLPQCDIIVSATASPNCTLKYEDMVKVHIKEGAIFIDLAVPRDMDPKIGEMSNITLFDIDSFGINFTSKETLQEIKNAEKILEEGKKEFIEWYEGKDIIPVITYIAEEMTKDLTVRIHKRIQKLLVSEEEKKALEEVIEKASDKTSHKLLFGLKEQLEVDTWRLCMEGIKKVYMQEKEV